MLTIIIPSRTDRLIDRLLISLRLSSPDSEYQVVIADNGLGQELRDKYPRAQFIGIRDPFCFAHAINEAASWAAPGNDIVIMNDDLIVESRDFIRKMECALQAGKRRGFGILSPITRGGVGNGDQAEELEPEEIKTTYGPICFITALIPRRVWNEVGGLDERFNDCYGCEDVDYSRRVVEAGWRVGVSGAGAVRHGDGTNPFSSTFRSQFSSHKLAHMSNLAGKIFEQKWGKARMGRYADLGATSIDEYAPIDDVDAPTATQWNAITSTPDTPEPEGAFSRARLLREVGPVPAHVLKYGRDTDLESDIDLLWGFARYAVPHVVVEIGTRKGTSTRAIVDAVRGRGCRVFTVDPDITCRRFVSGLVNCRFIHQYGQDFLATVRDPIDLLFIDADPHGYEDTLMWLGWVDRVLAPNGYALFHDIIENRPEIKVAAAVRDWVKGNPGWSWTEFPVRPNAYRWPQGGLGLLRRQIGG